MLKEETFSSQNITDQESLMTIRGTVYKTMLLTAILIASASFTGYQVLRSDPSALMPYLMGGAIGGLVLALATAFKPAWSPITASIYCICQGFVIGTVSVLMQAQYPGIVIQAFLLTIGILVALLFCYQAGFIKVTDNFSNGLMIAIGGVALIYLLTIILNLFGIKLPYIHDSGPIGIIFSLVVVVIASLSLLLDFEYIWQSSQNRAPKYMEWYGAFSLMVTLIWLYLEILTLLRKINGRK